jgi:hypothetical protein
VACRGDDRSLWEQLSVDGYRHEEQLSVNGYRRTGGAAGSHASRRGGDADGAQTVAYGDTYRRRVMAAVSAMAAVERRCRSWAMVIEGRR